MNVFEIVEAALLVMGVLVGITVAGFATTALCTALSSAKRWGVVHTPGSAVDNVVYRSREGSVFVFDFRFYPNFGWEAQIVRQPSYRGRHISLGSTHRARSHSGRHIAEWAEHAWTLDHAREQAATWAEATILYIRTGAFNTLVDRHPAGPQFDAATPEVQGSYDHPIPAFPIVRSDRVDTGAEYRTARGAIFVFDFRRRSTKWRTRVRRAPRLCSGTTCGHKIGVPEPRILGGYTATSLQEARSLAAVWAERTASFAATGNFDAPPPETLGGYTDTDA